MIKLNLMRNHKKGFLLAEETLKIILAVIAIVFLAYLLFSLYRANRGAEELNLAKASLNFLFQEVNAQKTEADIYNPEGWTINSWPNTYISGAWFWKTSEQRTPVSCTNLGWSSCICFCDGKSPDDCDSEGACLENPQGFKFEQPIEIFNPPIKLIVDYQNKKISKG